MNESTIDRYFGYLKHLDVSTKKKLIIRLTNSIDEGTTPRSGLASLFGGWVDDRSAEEIIADIRDSRMPSRKIEDL